MMGGLVYLLCAATSFACTFLLWRGWKRSRVRLLLWTALCFVGLALNNILLFVDMVLVPGVDLSLVRNLPALAGLAVLLVGMIWDSR
jgi:hypothetical protein